MAITPVRALPSVAATERALYGRDRAGLEVLLQAIAVPGKSPHVGRVSVLIMAARDGIWLDGMRRHDQIATRNALLACLDHARLTLT